MPTTLQFPRQPTEIEPDWLTVQLRRCGALAPDQRIAGLSVTPIGQGVGMLGSLARLELHYDGTPGPVASLVAKCATTSEANKAVAVALGLYEREVRFYRELAGTIGEGVPVCYAAEIDLSTWEYLLLLEDLVGYRAGDQAAGCGLRDAEICVDLVARVHASWWNSRKLASWPSVNGDRHRGGLVPATKAPYEPFVARFGHLLPREVLDAGPRFVGSLERLHHRMGEGDQTLIHGDFRLDNLLFGTTAGQHTLAVVDWQAVLVSKGVHDVAYLLSQNVTTPDRRRYERHLIGRYHSRLTAPTYWAIPSRSAGPTTALPPFGSTSTPSSQRAWTRPTNAGPRCRPSRRPPTRILVSVDR